MSDEHSLSRVGTYEFKEMLDPRENAWIGAWIDRAQTLREIVLKPERAP